MSETVPRPEASDAPDIVEPPMRIRVAQDGEGFWTCREAISGSPEYVRADALAALRAELADEQRRSNSLLETLDKYQAADIAESVSSVRLQKRAEAAEAELAEAKREIETQKELKKHARKCCDEADAEVARLKDENKELVAALEGACEQILDSYRTWVADDSKAHPRPGQIPRYDRARSLTAAKGG